MAQQARFICHAARRRAHGPTASTATVLEPLRMSRWRLIGANNRELGRIPATAPIDTVCCEAVAVLQVGLDRVTSRVRHAGPGSSWAWEIELDDVVVAVSGRSYLRQRECQYSLAQFLDAAGTAAFTARHCPLTQGLSR